MNPYLLSFIIICCCFFFFDPPTDNNWAILEFIIGIIKTAVLALFIYFIYFIIQKLGVRSLAIHNYSLLIVAIMSLLVGSYSFYQVPFSYERILKKNKRFVDRKLKREDKFMPKDELLTLDSSMVTNQIQSLFDTDFNKDVATKQESPDDLIYAFYDRHVDVWGDEGVLKYRNSLQCNFISYSPKLQEFFSIYTFESPHDGENRFGGFIAICEKTETQILIFPLNFEQTSGNSREYIKYMYLNWLYKKRQSQKKKHVWEIDLLSEQIEIDDLFYPKYQTKTVPVRDEYNVTKNVLKSHVTAEIIN